MLGPFRGLLEALERTAVLAQVELVGLLELVRQILHQALIEILASQEGVPVGGLDLEDSGIELEDGDVEGSTPQIVHRYLFSRSLLLLLQAVGQGRRGGLIDD